MEEKKSIKISLTTFFLLISIIIILIMAFFIYKLYSDKKISEKSIDELNNKISNLENTAQQNIIPQNTLPSNATTEKKDELVTLSIDSDTVQKLYEYILKSDDFDYSFAWSNSMEPTSFYKKNKVTYSSLSDMEKTLTVLKNYNNSEVKSVNKSSLKNVIDTTDIHDTVKVYENINTKASKIFNQSNSNWNNYTGCAGALEYKNNNYYLTEFYGGGKGTSEVGYSKIQKAEKDENYLYIYDKYIYIDSNNMDIGEGDSKVHIYTTADKMNDIGTETEEIWNSSSATERLYQKYENQLKTFKHTFEQTDDGNYYWLSSEIYN